MIDTPNSRESLLLLGQIDGKLSALVASFASHRDETQTRFAKHEAIHDATDERLTKVERLVWLSSIIASAIAAVAAAALSAFFPTVFK